MDGEDIIYIFNMFIWLLSKIRTSDKELITKIYEELLQVSNNKKQFKNWTKAVNRHQIRYTNGQ